MNPTNCAGMLGGLRLVRAEPSRSCRTADCRRRGLDVWGSLRFCPSCGEHMAARRGVRR